MIANKILVESRGLRKVGMMWAKPNYLWVAVALFCIPANAEETTFRVTKPSHTLYQISREVYGSDHMWKKIAEWNNINPPYALKKGQILIVRKTAAKETRQIASITRPSQTPPPQTI